MRAQIKSRLDDILCLLFPSPLPDADKDEAIPVYDLSFKCLVYVRWWYDDRISAKAFDNLEVHRGDANIKSLEICRFYRPCKVKVKRCINAESAEKVEAL